MDTLSQGPHFERGFEPELDLKLLQLPADLGLHDGSSWPGVRLAGSVSGLSSQDACLPRAGADLLESILRPPSVPAAQPMQTLQTPALAPLSGQHLPSSLGLHAYWPDALQPDAPHPQHSPHQAFCGGPLFTSNWSSLGLPQLPFRSMQQAVKETCSIAGTLSTSGGLLESLADVPLQPPLLKRSRTGEAGEFSLLLDASRHSRVPPSLPPKLPGTEQLVPQPCALQHHPPTFSPPSIPSCQPVLSSALRPHPSPGPAFPPQLAATCTEPAAAPTQPAAAQREQTEAEADAQLLAGLNEAMAGLPGWLCSAMRDSLYRISLLSEVQGPQGPQSLSGVDALVGRLLYRGPGRCSMPGSPPRGPISPAAGSPQLAPAKDGLPEAEVDKLLNQAWASSPVPECSLPGKCSSLEAVQRQEAQWQNEDFFACVPVCPTSTLQPETPTAGSLDLDWLEPSASMLLGDL